MNTEATIMDRFTKKDALSSRACLPRQAQRGICFLLIASSVFASLTAAEPKRPSILGIAAVTIAAPSDSEDFYAKKLGIPLWMIDCAGVCQSHFELSSHQELGILNRQPFDALTQKTTGSNIVQIAFETSDVQALHNYLLSKGVQAGEVTKSGHSGVNPLFSIVDPEHHRISFVELKEPNHYNRGEGQVSGHLIHAGFVVRDRAAMEHFYKDILGFRPYWHGGMKDNETDWLDLQVPDGTDWIEFMLNVPANADRRTLGIMNHIALGVPDIHAAVQQLLTNGMKLTEEPKIGRDGKWQLNLYDPDQTRVELMELTPVEKPCCSNYTGPHPKP